MFIAPFNQALPPYLLPDQPRLALTNVLMDARFKVVSRLERSRRGNAYDSAGMVANAYLCLPRVPGSRYFNITKLDINDSEPIHIDSLDKFIHHLAVSYVLD